jgi:sulfatase modifying factor 1
VRARYGGGGVAIVFAMLGVAGCTVVLGLDEKQLGVLDSGAGPDGGGDPDGFAHPGDDAASGPGDAGPVGQHDGDATMDGGGADGAALDANPTDGGSADASDASNASDAGDAGSIRTGCVALAHTCGANADRDCCASIVVPGGSFNRSSDSAFPATVSTFRLDTFEATIGRFRVFVAGYPANKPAAGVGKNPSFPGDTGWNSAWDSNLPADQASLVAGLKQMPGANWTDTPGAAENAPATCLTWYEAFAFCVWDGGRLPTEAEWNYAAAGGAEQRAYPWSIPPASSTIDSTYAVYGGIPTIPNVGSKSPLGDGRWGHADLAGSVIEWVRDTYDLYGNGVCKDCMDDNTNALANRGQRGGGVNDSASGLLTATRQYDLPSARRMSRGVRCARAQ